MMMMNLKKSFKKIREGSSRQLQLLIHRVRSLSNYCNIEKSISQSKSNKSVAQKLDKNQINKKPPM